MTDRIDRDAPDVTRIPVVEERLRVDKRATTDTAATIRLRTRSEDVSVDERLTREGIEIERVPADRIHDEPPRTRTEGTTTIIPVVEEVLVKRYRVVEEIRLTRRTDTVDHAEVVTLRRQRATVEPATTDDPA
ncbi:DUF2382 domain-containing protein [Jannaschia sp. LMIT008]|uniref:DUF2382 domain-containing protein n=1 Tax=Jannaschia maritima TaxID=3032585 RepID=UPI0028116762|nr:DUF2382 domain-containing protein [Jannaschia sp. LMIT008]